MLRVAVLAAAAAAAVVVVGSSAARAASPTFLDADAAPEAKTVTLLAVGEGQTKVGPPVRAVDADGDTLEYSLSDGYHLHASFFTIDSSNGQISLKENTRSGVYRVRVSVSDDEFDSDDSDTATVDVTIHVTSPGHYPWEDAWVLARSMTASGETAYNQLGWWLDTTSEVVVVAAPQSDPSAAGAVYVFDADSGAQLAKLTSPNPESSGQFGNSVAVAGDTVFAGAWAENSRKGRLYAFTKPATGWADTSTATATLTPAAAHTGTTLFSSGIGVSDDGNTLVAGMSGFSTFGGAVFVFTKPATGWADADTDDTGVVTLRAGTRIGIGNFLGNAVAISGDGNTIAASAPFAASDGVYHQGAVFVFTKPATGWAATTSSTAVPRLSVDGPTRRQMLGNWGLALSYDGSTLVAAAATPWRKGESDDSQIPDDYYGSAYVYARPSGGWADATETAELASFGHKYDFFGRGVAVSGSGDKIAVGNAESRSSNYRGSVYVYTKPAGGWSDDLDGAGDNLRVLTLADADTNTKHRYAFGGRGLVFIGEDELVAGQTGHVEALSKDDPSALPAGGLYGANADHSSNSNILPGSAHLFQLRQVPQQQPQQQPVAPPAPLPPPPPPPPDEPQAPPEFADVDEGSVHAESIEQVAALGITTGTTATTFSPSDTVTRAQMATFVTRTWEAADRECPSSGILFFDDVPAGSTHARGIDCVSALGITSGTADRTFSPSEPVTRAQMAAFLARAWVAAGRTCPDDAGASFDDVPAGSAHAADIDCIAALGITSGTTAETFSPSDTVTRAQMATFLARFHEALTDTA